MSGRSSALDITLDLQAAQQQLDRFASTLSERTPNAAAVAAKSVENLERRLNTGRLTTADAHNELERLRTRLTQTTPATNTLCGCMDTLDSRIKTMTGNLSIAARH